MASSTFYLAVALVALLVGLWLALQIMGAVLKLLFIVAIALIAVAAIRAWRNALERQRRMGGGGLIIVLFFLGLATAVVGKIKGSSFFIWFAVGFFLPIAGLIAAILYRFERHEPKRRCPRCGAVREIADQVCAICGEELYWPRPEELVQPKRGVRSRRKTEG